MSHYQLSTSEIPRRDYEIRAVPHDRPLQWLKLGWRDFIDRPGLGILYGAIVAVAGFLLIYELRVQGMFYLVPAFTAGFLLIAPLFAIGLMADARLRYSLGKVNAEETGKTVRQNLVSIGNMGLILMLIFLNWLMLSNLLFGGVSQAVLPTWGDVRPLSALWSESFTFFAVYIGIGVLLAACVFRLSAMSVPMLIDQKVDVFNAIFASWKAVGENAGTMTLWALLIALLCAIGFITLFIGFVVVIPVLGYASWHAYQEILQPADGAS